MRPLKLLGITLLLAAASAGTAASAQDALLTADQAFRVTAVQRATDHVTLIWAIAPGYAVYRDKVKVAADDAGVRVGTVALPAGQEIEDPAFGKVAIFRDQFSMRVPYNVRGPSAGRAIVVQVQGCHKVEPLVCFPPYAVKVQLEVGRS